MLKSYFGIEKKIIKVYFKGLKQRITYLILNGSRKFIVKSEFFYNKVKIIYKSILDKFFYLMI
jgi:hypothetical protein